MTNSKEINFFNIKTQEITRGILRYHIKPNLCIIEVRVDSIDISIEDINCFEALGIIREKIYPLEPMILGTQKYIMPTQGYGWFSFYPNMILGKQYDRKNKLPFFYPTKEKDFAQPEIQKAFMSLYQGSFKSEGIYGLKEEYNLRGNIVLLEKIAKYRYLPDKILNKNYQYFWVLDKDIDKVYNIKNKKDIELYIKNKLSPEWQSLDKFIEWYANNWMNKER